MNALEVKNENQLQPIIGLLKESKLPFADVTLGDGKLFVSYHDDHNNLIASGGLELYADYSLLRSLAVRAPWRGASVGKQIVSDLLNRAREKSVKEVYLLTETAHDFFIKLGFQDIDRAQVPDRIKCSTEFSSVCPVSAACMIYTLSG